MRRSADMERQSALGEYNFAYGDRGGRFCSLVAPGLTPLWMHPTAVHHWAPGASDEEMGVSGGCTSVPVYPREPGGHEPSRSDYAWPFGTNTDVHSSMCILGPGQTSP